MSNLFTIVHTKCKKMISVDINVENTSKYMAFDRIEINVDNWERGGGGGGGAAHSV